MINGLRADDRGDPDFDALLSEHEAYVEALKAAGVETTVLPALETFPDSIFVEDPALVFPEGAVLLRPGAHSRAGEAKEIAPRLRERFKTVLEFPEGHAEGGDILTTPSKVMIGLSNRTDLAGARMLQTCLQKLGRKSEIVKTPNDVLHFKSDCALLDHETVLTTRRLSKSGVFNDYKEITVPQGEEAAANALRVNGVVLLGAEFPRTAAVLDEHGYDVVLLPVGEIGKIDAGLSCMSLRWFEK